MDPYCQNSFITADTQILNSLTQLQRSSHPFVCYISGPRGTGKTAFARAALRNHGPFLEINAADSSGQSRIKALCRRPNAHLILHNAHLTSVAFLTFLRKQHTRLADRNLLILTPVMPTLIWPSTHPDLVIPPLARRKKDILMHCTQILALHQPLQLSSAAKSWVCQYSWPGEVQQLRRALSAACFYSKRNETLKEGDIKRQIPSCYNSEVTELAQLCMSDRFIDIIKSLGLRQAEQILEASVIAQAMYANEGNQQLTAKDLGIPLNTLVNKIRRNDQMDQARERALGFDQL